MRNSPAQPDRKSINLALQGGAAHGAFTWGARPALEDPRVDIDGICGTSAGAINAVAVAHGLTLGGTSEARAALDRFWPGIGEVGRFSPIQRGPIDRLVGSWRLDYSPSYVAFDLLTRSLSPYQTNPLNHNPFEKVLEQVVDFDAVRACTTVKLFVCATNVRTGKVRVFETAEICLEAILASACLPFLFRAVEYQGEHCWDGGYMGNPVIFPLIYGCESRDVLIVQINPVQREGIPTTAREILDRVNEISFNSSLMREMRAVAFVTKLIDSGGLGSREYKRMFIHRIEADEQIKPLGASSKLNAEHLKAIGRAAAGAWLERNFDRIGVESTLDLLETYL